jgi:hypothetical protein
MKAARLDAVIDGILSIARRAPFANQPNDEAIYKSKPNPGSIPGTIGYLERIQLRDGKSSPLSEAH